MEDEAIVALFWRRSPQAIEELDKKYGRLCRKLQDYLGEQEV